MKNIDILKQLEELKDLELTANSVTIADATNVFEATTVEDALLENKSSILNNKSEIDNLKLSVVDGKSKVASAIGDKGVPTLATDTFDTMSTNISNIKGMPSGWDLEETGEVFDGDIMENDAIVWQKYGDWESSIEVEIDPFEIPINYEITHSCFSKDGKYFCIGSKLNKILIYKIVNDKFIKLPNPSIMPNDYAEFCQFSNDSKYLCLGVYNSEIILYKIEDDTFTKIPTPSSIKFIKWCSFSCDDKYLILNTTGDLYMLKFNDDSTVTSISLSNITTYNTIKTCTFLPNSYDLIITEYTSSTTTRSTIELYTFSSEQWSYKTFYYSPSGGSSYSTCSTFSNDGKYFCATFTTPDRIKLYKVNGNSLSDITSKLSQTITVGGAYSCSFSNCGNYLCVGSDTTSGQTLYVYKIDNINDTFTKLDSSIFSKYPSGQVLTNCFSIDNTFLFSGSKFLGEHCLMYRTQTKNIVSKYNIPNLPYYKLNTKQIGVAMESKSIGEQINVNLFPKLNIK